MAIRGEYLLGAEAAEVAPGIAVRCRGHGGVVEPYMLAGRQARAVGQDDVVLGEAFFDGGRRGNDNHELGSESEGENWTVLL